MATNSKNKFPLGRVVITRCAAAVIPQYEGQRGLLRHGTGDWGEVDSEDRKENELSLKEGFSLYSVYRTAAGQPFWIITEGDRSVTTILLTEEY